ncbi:MAG: sulfite exporter TauE/SafE family protein [Actinomycetota bacterium]
MLFGVFGVGGSSFATPVLSLLGVPPLFAVASALPATVPSALSGAISYIRRGDMDWRVARLSIAGGLPATVAGALLSRVVGGHWLLVASGVVLGVVGLRVLRPIGAKAQAKSAHRRDRTGLVVAASAGVGLFTGLLANGGGFLLVPLYLLIFGLSMRKSSGTSLAVIAALSVPTLITHWALGNIDWAVAGAFAVGCIPAAYLGGRLADHFEGNHVRIAFGCLLVVFATYFVIRQVL